MNKQYKATKMGELPGDLPRRQRIDFLENPLGSLAKSYKKAHVK